MAWRGGVRKERGELKKRKGKVNTTRSRSVLGGRLCPSGPSDGVQILVLFS